MLLLLHLPLLGGTERGRLFGDEVSLVGEGSECGDRVESGVDGVVWESPEAGGVLAARRGTVATRRGSSPN